ncbi:hypothetical protein TNCV_3124081 [Trichonephila clavipes]|nr:hypothetical protein TNCV_3124081 [Trichonephila clavipes]
MTDSTKKPFRLQKSNHLVVLPPRLDQNVSIPATTRSGRKIAKASTATTTQTDENITKIVCPPLKLLQPFISIPKRTISSSVPVVTKSSTSTQAQVLPSISSESQPPIPLIDIAPTTSNSLSTSAASSSSTVSMFTPLPASCPVLQTTTTTSNTIPSTSQEAKLTSKLRKKTVHLKTHVIL